MLRRPTDRGIRSMACRESAAKTQPLHSHLSICCAIRHPTAVGRLSDPLLIYSDNQAALIPSPEPKIARRHPIESAVGRLALVPATRAPRQDLEMPASKCPPANALQSVAIPCRRPSRRVPRVAQSSWG